MMRKLLAFLLSMLMIVSTMIIIKPENFDAKASRVGGIGAHANEIDTYYIHNVTQQLSDIVFTNPKGRAFGTPGERQAAQEIKTWMNQIGLSNVHLENITGTTQHPELNTTEDIISEGIYIGGHRLTECYISPLLNDTNDNLAHNYSYHGLDVRTPGSFPWANRLFDKKSFIHDLLERITNHSIHDLPTFFEFCLDQFEETYDFSLDTLNVSDPDTYPSWCNGTFLNTTGWSPFLYIQQEDNFNPFDTLPKALQNLNPLGDAPLFYYKFLMYMKTWWWNISSKGLFRGLIKYDFNNDTYNMQEVDNIFLQNLCPQCICYQPILFITGKDGKPLYNSIPDGQPSSTKVSYWVNETFNKTVISANVVGQINGTDPSKIVLISCLYDCMWNQGTSDSAIGMGTVLAIAKYFKNHHIKPKYTLKFVAFAGEEKGGIGAQYYNDIHTPKNLNTTENITTIIDLNQLGFNKTGSLPQTFYVNTNKMLLIPTLKYITDDTNYRNRSETPFLHIDWSYNGGPSDCSLLVQGDYSRTSILFVKDMNWTLHHRAGKNNTKGDTMEYYDSADVSATMNMIWNVTKYFVVNPNCSFDGAITYTTKNSTNHGDNYVDTVEADMPIKSVLPVDHIRVKAELRQLGHILPAVIMIRDYIITNTTTHCTVSITLPPGSSPGYYKMYLYLLNSTERINDIKIFGYGKPNQTTNSTYLHLEGSHQLINTEALCGSQTPQAGERESLKTSSSYSNRDLVYSIYDTSTMNLE
jgi:hypothetical protein